MGESALCCCVIIVGVGEEGIIVHPRSVVGIVGAGPRGMGGNRRGNLGRGHRGMGRDWWGKAGKRLGVRNRRLRRERRRLGGERKALRGKGRNLRVRGRMKGRSRGEGEVGYSSRQSQSSAPQGASQWYSLWDNLPTADS